MLNKFAHIGQAIFWGSALWIIGFVWGLIVFAFPTLKSVPSIPYVSKYPWISGILLVTYVTLLKFISKKDLGASSPTQVMKFGITMLAVNFVLDFGVYFAFFGSSDYFSYLSIWVSYLLFPSVPWLTVRKAERVNGPCLTGEVN